MSSQASIVRMSRLAAEDRESMLELYARYFSHVRRERFLEALSEKDWVIRLTHAGQIVGFSTQCLMTLSHDGRDHRVLFSGDTIVDRAFWYEHELAGAFGHLILRLMQDYGEDRLCWFLISKGFRTYRFLPVFFNRFWPSPTSAAGDRRPALLAAAARARFGAAYDEERGLIVAAEDGDRLRPDMCDVPAARRRDPYVRFFLERNPDFAQGDELACLAELRRGNLNPHAWRVIERTVPEWIE